MGEDQFTTNSVGITATAVRQTLLSRNVKRVAVLLWIGNGAGLTTLRWETDSGTPQEFTAPVLEPALYKYSDFGPLVSCELTAVHDVGANTVSAIELLLVR